jgi:outer membrane protein TolC
MRKIFFVTVVVFLLLAPIRMPFAGTEETSEFNASANGGVPRFTINQAILTALQRNPDIQRAKQEIERTKGIFLELRGEAFPRIDAVGSVTNTDPHLNTIGRGSGSGEDAGVPTSYVLRIQASQPIFSGGRIFAQIRGAEFQRDAAYFSFRETIDTVIALVRQQFYQVLLNRALIGVQEESVSLLESQLRDQQNRFEAGTVPRFNVLQAQVALSNQYPELISARNNYRISQIQLARTMGLDFNPNRGDAAPLEAIGELRQEPRPMALARAIEVAKERRPLLKREKANVLSSNQQVNIARSNFLPQVNATASADARSNAISENINDARTGYVVGASGTWNIWDWGQNLGRLKQARAVLEQSKITLDDAGRQVELEVQQAYSNLQQGAELIRSQQQNVGQAQEALRLASARLGAGAGTQLEVLNARVEVTRAQSTTLQALYSYNAALAEFDRVTATEVIYANALDDPKTRDRVKTDAKPTPAPKPTPLPLNNAGVREPVSTRAGTRRDYK